MWQGFTGWHALIILVVILLLFGAPKLPALARSLGQSMKILKTEVVPTRPTATRRARRRRAQGRRARAPARAPDPVTAVKDRGERNREKRMSLGAHLIELRKRLFISAIAIVVGAALGWWLTDAFVWEAIQEPVQDVAEAQGSDTAIVFPTISSAFDLRLQIAFTLGLVISSPVWLYQIFAFLVPGLNTKERRFTLRVLRDGDPAVPRGLRGRLVRAAEHRQAHDELRARRRRCRCSQRRSTSTSC